jgi:SAM-dependent methyltransferase
MDSDAWNRRYAGRELVWSGEPNRFLVAEAQDLAPGRALDLACGEGRNAIWLAARGWRVTGVDFSAVALAKAGELARERAVEVDWRVADLVGYRPQRRAFDLVILFYLQVPAPQRGTIVRVAAEAVAPGGMFVLVGHDRSNPAEGYGGPGDPAVLYTAQDIAGDLAGTGLHVERAERVERPVSTPDGQRRALDALVRARRPPAAGGVTGA